MRIGNLRQRYHDPAALHDNNAGKKEVIVWKEFIIPKRLRKSGRNIGRKIDFFCKWRMAW